MLKYPLRLNNSIKLCQNVPFWLTHQIQIRNQHENANNSANTQSSFQNEVRKRQLQAKRSIFVETDSDSDSIKDFTSYCSRLGQIQNLYRSYVNEKTYFLVEFNNPHRANEIVRTAFHSGFHSIDGKVRTKGRFLYFNPTNESTAKQNHLSYKRETNLTESKTILKAMQNERTIDNQMMTLYNVNRLSDLSCRLRFLTALQMEEVVSGVLHDAQVLPFGSSVNGFGQMQSDLDMVLMTNGNKLRKTQFSSMELGQPVEMGRQTTRNNLFVLSQIARNWLHGVVQVNPVLNARVPIIKYVQTLTQLDCDLSMTNYSGFQMSEIFYTFGELDKRVRPLVFFIRAWAKEFDITSGGHPSPGISNFMLTCLVIFYLQRLPKPILPPSNAFVKHHDLNENMQYITDISALNFQSENKSNLSELLVQFFEYYMKFDFNKDAASISTGTIKANIAQDSIFIYNLLDPTLNVCRNVNDFERNQFIEMCQKAHKALTQDKIDAVGLLQLQRQKHNPNKLDTFVNSMMAPRGKQNINLSNTNRKKLNIKTIMK